MLKLFLSRCPVGEDWWYIGEKCETKETRQDTVTIAVASSLSIFAVMLIITVVTACCIKKKYTKKLKAVNNLQLRNVSILVVAM